MRLVTAPRVSDGRLPWWDRNVRLAFVIAALAICWLASRTEGVTREILLWLDVVVAFGLVGFQWRHRIAKRLSKSK